MKCLWFSLLLAAVLPWAGCATSGKKSAAPLSAHAAAQWRAEAVKGCYGTYNTPPRFENTRVDCVKLLAELKDIHANTYHWCISRGTNDWDDLKTFLPMARKENINVWVTLLPPSESPPRYRYGSEPYRLDFMRWADEIGRLSLQETNLTAWSIDDFAHNLSYFTTNYTAEFIGKARSINPKLAFVPCLYYRQINPTFAARYRPWLDGALFPYRAESEATPNLQNPNLVAAETATLRQRLGPGVPVILDIYATAHSKLGGTTPAYVRDAMRGGREACDGVLIYCHQHPVKEAEKYQIEKEEFGAWAAAGKWPRK